MLKENVVVVKTVENEEGAHNFQTACQTATRPLRENVKEWARREGKSSDLHDLWTFYIHVPVLNDQAERTLYQPLHRETAPVKKQLKS